MSTPNTAENTIRVHDQAFVNWLNSYLVDYGTLGGAARNQVPVLSVFASPHRAFATTVDTLVSRGWISAVNPEDQRYFAEQNWPVLPLPVATIERDDPIISNELSLVPGSFRKTFFNDQTGLWETYDFPGHYITQYRLTFWCEKRATHAHFMEWLMSQLGQRGAGSTEVMIPVQHVAPFGEILHALRYLGSGNMSDLEGFDARHIRSQLSFTLRSWFFRRVITPDARGTPIFSTGFSATANGLSSSDLETFPQDAAWGTNNLFTTGAFGQGGPTMVWPGLFGTATAEKSTTGDGGRSADLVSTVTETTDAVTLVQLPLNLNSSGYGVISVAASYEASAPATLSIEHALMPTELVPDAVYTQTQTHDLTEVSSPLWNRLHTFAVVSLPMFAVRIQGAGALSTVTTSGTDVRQIADQAKVVPTSWSTVGGDRVYVWSGLNTAPYLVIVTFTTAVDGTVSASYGAGAALPQHSQVVFPETPGAAILIQPVGGEVSLSVPLGCVVANVYAQPYNGPYYGNSL